MFRFLDELYVGMREIDAFLERPSSSLIRLLTSSHLFILFFSTVQCPSGRLLNVDDWFFSETSGHETILKMIIISLSKDNWGRGRWRLADGLRLLPLKSLLSLACLGRQVPCQGILYLDSLPFKGHTETQIIQKHRWYKNTDNTKMQIIQKHRWYKQLHPGVLTRWPVYTSLKEFPMECTVFGWTNSS